MRKVLSLGLFLTLTTVASGQQIGISVPNWTVPPYQPSGSAGGLTTMTDISPGITYVAMQPCRVFDTRNPAGPFGGPRLLANATRNFDIDNGPCTGIPAEVEAYSMNFGAILPDVANSFVTIWPTGSAQPLVSSMNPILGGVVANAAIVPAGTAGSISVFSNTGLHLYGDINGYFTDTFNSGRQVLMFGNVDDFMLHVENASSGDDSGAILGNASATTGLTWGVRGHTSSSTSGSAGIRGNAVSTAGTTYGVVGVTYSGASEAAGVFGLGNPNATGRNYGVHGVTLSTAPGTAGVYGVAPPGDPMPENRLRDSAGVRAAGKVGLWASSTFAAVIAERVNDVGVEVAGATLGAPGGFGTVGVLATGDIEASGEKLFIDPHPTDPKKEIAYVALEGPEAGTYFRGRGRIEGGSAVIPVPESFRLVSDEEGLTVQITPIGEPATIAVVSADLDSIVVRSTEDDVEFYYLVNGVRRAFNRHEPVRENRHYVPDRPDARMPLAYSPEQRRRLVVTGIYNDDGTVNLETARRLGWDKMWEERARPAPQPEAP